MGQDRAGKNKIVRIGDNKMRCDVDLDELCTRVGDRICLHSLRKVAGVDIVVGGGCVLAAEPKDFDVYAATPAAPLDRPGIIERAIAAGWTRLASTKNAITFSDTNGKVVQFCQYVKESPQELIESFDFAHCQAGIVVDKLQDSSDITTRVVFTPAFLKAMAMQRTFFVGSEYPLSSLIRLVKYAKRGLYGDDRGYIPDMCKIMAAMLDRGYSGYDDFKDQLDAIDLSYAGDNAVNLWTAIKKRFNNEPQSTLASIKEGDFPF